MKITVFSRTLTNFGFTVDKHSDPELQGVHPDNICNIGRSGAEVQLELSEGLRKSFLLHLTVLAGYSQRVSWIGSAKP